MTKAINDATLTKAGDTFQHLIALKDCFDMESGETLQRELSLKSLLLIMSTARG